MFETKNAVLGGSQTAGRGAEDLLHAGAEAAYGIGRMATSNPLSAALAAWKTAKLLGLKPSPETNAAVARLVTDPGVTPTQSASGGLAMSPTGLPVQRQRPPYAASLLSSAVGNIARQWQQGQQ